MLTARGNRCGTVWITLGAVALLCAQAGAAPDAAAILKKAQAALASAKTYQATIVDTTSVSTMGSITMQTEIKAVPATGKAAIRRSVVGTPTGKMAAQARMGQMIAVDNGKTAYVYSKAMGGYRKGPHQPGQSKMRLPLQGIASVPGVKYKLVGTEKVDGRPAYAIELVPPSQRPGVTQKVIAFVDKDTGRMVGIRQTASAKGPGGKGPDIHQTTIVTIKNERINAPIPDSVFTFVPPPGAKEIAATPPAGGPLGAPAAPSPGKK